MADGQCWNCAYWQTHRYADPDCIEAGTADEFLAATTGECHRHAPRPATVGMDAIGGHMGTFWPVTYGDSFCGEHKALAHADCEDRCQELVSHGRARLQKAKSEN